MLNSLVSVKNDAKARFYDIQIMLDVLKNNNKVDYQVILKSSLVLMIYNFVEGVMNNLIITLFDVLQQENLSIKQLPNKFQKTIFDYYLKKIGNNSGNLRRYYGYDDVKICKISYEEISKYLKFFSGNLDAKSIREISCDKFGISLPNGIDEPALLKVKNYRNKLAHGETKFSNTCQDITLEEMEYMCKQVDTYLNTIIDSYENFLNSIWFQKTINKFNCK